MKLHGNMNIVNGELNIGGIGAEALVEEFQTPVIVYDEAAIRKRCEVFRKHFVSERFETAVTYASKAFSCKAMCALVAEEGLSLDVVSEGELYTALAAGFPTDRIYFHGNNKLPREMEMAISAGVGTFIVDGISEARRLDAILADEGKTQEVLLRVNPGIDAHTHEYIQTATSDSKFGESTTDDRTLETLRFLEASEHIVLRGIHCHIGSQIFEADSFRKAAAVMADYMTEIREKTGIVLDTLNLGGGFGVYYTEGDNPFELATFLEQLVADVETVVEEKNLPLKRLIIEPGRSMVCTSAVTLYTVGDTKTLPSGMRFAFIDGGMNDNPRPALYEAVYEAALANRMDEAPAAEYRIGGKCCESGDILIRNITLPEVKTGDLLAVSSTGAYTYSMSGNYNRIGRPAVVFVKDGTARLVVRRESLDDLIRNDL